MKVSPEGVNTAVEERDGMGYATVNWGEPNVPDLINPLNPRKVGERGR
jgi:hypothetical protein